jgi:hypothetical protein
VESCRKKYLSEDKHYVKLDFDSILLEELDINRHVWFHEGTGKACDQYRIGTMLFLYQSKEAQQ